MTIFIYKFSFPLKFTHKVYIGKTNNPKEREYEHNRLAKNGSEYAIYRAMRKYGIENAIFEIIATVLKEEYANEAEIALIKQYDSFGPNGYNMTIGGDGLGSRYGEDNPMFGKTHTEETKKKQSDAKLGKFGNQSNHSEVWILYTEDSKIHMIDNLNQWCKQNEYNYKCISNVYRGRAKSHKDIIKVEKLS